MRTLSEPHVHRAWHLTMEGARSTQDALITQWENGCLPCHRSGQMHLHIDFASIPAAICLEVMPSSLSVHSNTAFNNPAYVHTPKNLGFLILFFQRTQKDIKRAMRWHLWLDVEYARSTQPVLMQRFSRNQSCRSSESRRGHSSSWLSRWLLWRCVRRALGFISIWYEILSWAQAEWAEINTLRWSTTAKQLSGLRWQNEYWRRPINAGIGPSMKYHSQPGD